VLVQRAGDHLGAGCELVLLLMRYRFALDAEAYRVLRSYLSPLVNDSVEQGWEECTEAAMTHLLRTTLSKSSKDAVSITTQLAPLQDTSKLKKQIGVVCERLARGASLTRDQ
jgi:Bardet-Biedl syndrome 9 protein